MIRVAVCDDERLVRDAFAALLQARSGLEVVGEAADGAQAVALARRARPDVLCMDVRMPVLDGIEATRQITADPTLAGCRVLILTTFDDDASVFAALRAGASGFLLKDTPPEDLLTAIEVVAAGEALLAPTVTRRIVDDYARRAPVPAAAAAALDPLTDREREVLLAVAQGWSNAEISDRLAMAYPTAKTHVSRLLTKLGARDRAQLVVIAYETGLMTPGGG